MTLSKERVVAYSQAPQSILAEDSDHKFGTISTGDWRNLRKKKKHIGEGRSRELGQGFNVLLGRPRRSKVRAEAQGLQQGRTRNGPPNEWPATLPLGKKAPTLKDSNQVEFQNI